MADRVAEVLGEGRETATRRVLDRMRTYVEMETPSRSEGHVRALATVIQSDLRQAGATADLIDAPGYGAHVVGVIGNDGRDHIAILSHMDTVHPVGTLATQPFRVNGDRVEGPGTYDMKAGIAIAVEALLLMQRRGTRPQRPVRFIITCDEEVGSHSGLPVIREHAQGASAVLVTEPCVAGGLAKTSRKGVLTYKMTISGRAAHAGTHPQNGVSAITELAHQIRSVLALADWSQGTTLNVGVVNGGTASNVVAAQAFAEIDVRVTNAAETERVHNALLSLRAHTDGAQVTVLQTEKRPPLERTPQVVALYERARAIAAELDFDMKEGSSGGGSDGSFTAALGLPTLDGLGPDGGGAHAVDEHVLLADIPLRLALFTRMLESL
ncbi:MAG TPA: M20/M25/M40 family metallo-hydrolase [Longimicrobiales bacterium]